MFSHLIATSEVLNGLIASILAALFITVVLWIYSWSRNLLLERGLEKAINSNNIGTEFNLSPLHAVFRLQIHNYTNAYIRVRTVILMADDYPIELHPDKKYGLFQNPLSLEAQRKKFNKKYLSGASLGQDNNPHSILLPPKTNAGWCVDLQTIGKYEQIITDVFIVFEYATIFGNAAMVRIKIKNLAFNLIKENFENLSRDASKKQPIKKTTIVS